MVLQNTVLSLRKITRKQICVVLLYLFNYDHLTIPKLADV